MTITDITDDCNEPNGNVILHYAPSDTPMPRIRNRVLKQLIDENFDEDEFPEYRKIAYEACAYITSNKLVDVDPTLFVVVVYPDSPLAKGHDKHEKFVRLFALVFELHGTKVHLANILMNASLVSEKLALSDGRKRYNDTVYDNPDDTVTNSESCTICLQSVGTMITTPCAHTFHLDCLKCTPKMLCPICRLDLADFLVQSGVSKEEIDTRIMDQQNEQQLEQVRHAIDHIDLTLLTDVDFLKLCTTTLKLNRGDVRVYTDIILEMNTEAAAKFARLSCLNSLYRQGVFLYFFDSHIDYLLHMFNPMSKSIVEWRSLSYFKGTPIAPMIKNKLCQLKNTAEEYVVVVMIENVVNVQIINIGDEAIRIDYDDILLSLLKGCKCRYFGHTPDDPNREDAWATKALARLEKKVGIKSKN
jgi:hypothetical protein